jgi:UDP-3-O-[3-hydroxymyristoyl] N-acetylglucosamine deacetylase/3-hydroxyacyl-[acyl-carrier-protein] dehydratase
MAAMYCCGIDNALVEINAPETPIMDGSSKEYAAKFQEVGLTEQNAPIEYFEINQKYTFEIAEKGVKVEILPDDKLSVNVNIDYNSKVLGNQYAVLENIEDFAKEVSSCRTFVFLHELEPLFKLNLIKGGDLDNAIVIVESPVSDEELARISNVFNKSNEIKVTNGFLNNLELRFPNECARHKLLDILGDLALIGRRIKGRVIATRPGHFANTEMAKKVRQVLRKAANRPTHKYDPAAEPVMDINQIKGMLPHRPPFLLVDKIMYLDDHSVMGIKNVTMNEPFFVGHFPSHPVMPGVLIVEAMAQCGGLLVISQLEDKGNYSTYFLKIDNVRFKHKVTPGDTLQIECELACPVRRGIATMLCRAFVSGTLVCEAELMAQIVKNK